MKFFKRMSLAIGMTSLLFVATACGGGDSATDENQNQANDNEKNEHVEEISGSVAIDGSGTVYPLMARLAEEFMINEHEDVSVEVSRAGTSAGMKKFIAGETDFSNASRQIKEEELSELEANGIDVQEFKVALDGLTIVINPENDWATEMTKDEIVKAFLKGGIKEDDVIKWSDIRPEWPDEEIKLYGPNENHGTNEFFIDVILEEQELNETTNLQQEYSTLVDLISKDKNALGFFGYGYYASNTDKITAVKVDFGNGPVEPSLETIKEDGDYAPFTRPVFTYLNLGAAKEKPQVKAFAEYVFKNANEFAGETGFAPLTDEEMAGYLEIIQNIK